MKARDARGVASRARPPIFFALSAAATIHCGTGSQSGVQSQVPCSVATGVANARYTSMGPHQDLTPGACAKLVQDWGGLPPDVDQFPLDLREYAPDGRTGPDKRSLSIAPQWIDLQIEAAQTYAGLPTYPYPADAAPPPPPADPSATNRPFAWGFFDSAYADENGICTATLNASDLVYPVTPPYTLPCGMMFPYTPQRAVRYEWRNVRVVVRGMPVGQEIFADVTITMDGCQGQYQVVILYPRVSCIMYLGDGGFAEDPTACRPNADAGLPASVPIDCEDIGQASPSLGPDWECVPAATSP